MGGKIRDKDGEEGRAGPGRGGGRGKPSPGVGGRRDGVHVRPGDTSLLWIIRVQAPVKVLAAQPCLTP